MTFQVDVVVPTSVYQLFRLPRPRERADPHTARGQYHDIGPARSLGLATAWIERRRGQPGGGATPVAKAHTTPDFHFASLAEMAAAHRAVSRAI